MKRSLLKKLKQWKQSTNRKPLLLMGARQVGKTTLLNNFGKQDYENIVTLNFDSHPDLKSLFDQDLNPSRIIKDVNLALGVKIIPEKTLLFLDEIQECSNALNSLKYFNEEANEYHVCGAGSLLGVKLAHKEGFPVGKVHFETLYPLSFIEYLDAMEQAELSEYLTTLTLKDKISEAIHNKLIQQLKCYLFTGGMPEAVDKYKKNEDFEATRTIHQDIIRAYELDFTQHAPSSLITKITECFHSITSQLAKENKKFIYSIIRKGARARNYEDALQWLAEAGLIYKVYNINTPKLPLKAYENRQSFKIYAVDVGLLNTMANLPIKTIVEKNELFKEFHGSLTENFVAQELAQHAQQLHYWTSQNQAEIDFIFHHEDNIFPLEVKSGYTNQKKSLIVYRDKYKPKLILRTSPQNLDKQDRFVNLPLYLIGQLPRLLRHL